MVLLLGNEWLSYDICSMERRGDVLKLELDGPSISFLPGQFVILRIPKNGKKVERPYSLASSPLSKTIRFYIKLVGGEFTSLIEKMGVGERIELRGPFGHMVFKNEEKLMCFGAGVGIAPFVSIAEHLTLTKMSGKYIFFSSAKKMDDAIWLEDIKKMDGSFKFIQHITREEVEERRIKENVLLRGGRIKKKDVEKEIVDGMRCFICGSKSFAEGTKNMLKELGIEESNIKMESWG